jgi:glycosyltransferase involved in cell wall biosynthesis
VAVDAPTSPGSATSTLAHPEYRSTTARGSAELEIVIPAYNEASRLPSTLLTTMNFLATQPWRSRVVVVDNGSDDDTVGAVRAVASGDLLRAVPVDIIGCAQPGKGAAVRRGLLSSTSRFVGFFDADLSTPVETLTAAMHHLRQGATAVIGSRHVAGSRIVRKQPLSRRAGGTAFRMMTQRAVQGVQDTQCGFKFFQRDPAIRAMVQCRTSGFAFDVEFLRRLQRDGGVIVEVPVSWTDNPCSTFRTIRDGIASFTAVMQIRQC